MLFRSDLKHANDASIAIIAVVVMFLIPNGKGGALLDWESANKIPWGVLLLFSGGMCIASAFENSGLSKMLSYYLGAITTWHPILIIFLTCVFVSFLSEVTSNTALTALLMPILAATAKNSQINPLLLMIPAVIAASAAFMLAAGTAPNTIVFGTGRIKSKDMAMSGLILNLLGAIIVTIVVYVVLILILKIDVKLPIK